MVTWSQCTGQGSNGHDREKKNGVYFVFYWSWIDTKWWTLGRPGRRSPMKDLAWATVVQIITEPALLFASFSFCLRWHWWPVVQIQERVSDHGPRALQRRSYLENLCHAKNIRTNGDKCLYGRRPSAGKESLDDLLCWSVLEKSLHLSPGQQ